jgi:outer membrane protein assembly factor BamA
LYALAIFTIAHADDLTPPAEFEGKPVAHIRFDPPAQPLSSENLSRLVALSEGAPLHLADVRGAIKRLYGTGEYASIEADTEPAPGGLNLIFRTTGQWFVGPVEVRGKLNLPPNPGQLTGATRLNLGTPFNESDVDTAVDNLRSLLQRNGLYRGTITPKVERDPQHQEVSITFQVNTGKRARYALPNVIGDTKIPADEVAHAAKYKEILFFPWKPVTQTRTQAGLQSVRGRYEKKDRLTAAVTLDHADYLSAENRVRPTIRADGGPVIKIVAEGAKVSKGTLERYVPVFDEATVNQDLLVTGARNLRDYFQNRGYFDVQVDLTSHNKTPDLEVITYTVSLGDLHRVLSVNVKGNRYCATAATAKALPAATRRPS